MRNDGYKQSAAVGTINSIVKKAIIGVTEGFRYRMKMVHAHFTINSLLDQDARGLHELRPKE